jgi:hypothetical protein
MLATKEGEVTVYYRLFDLGGGLAGARVVAGASSEIQVIAQSAKVSAMKAAATDDDKSLLTDLSVCVHGT